MKRISLFTFLLVVILCLLSCESGLKPEIKISGPLSDYFEVVDKSYSIQEGDDGYSIYVEIKRIKEGLPSPWEDGMEVGQRLGCVEPRFYIELKDENGQILFEDDTDLVSEERELEAIISLDLKKTATIPFEVSSDVKGKASSFSIGSTFKIHERIISSKAVVYDNVNAEIPQHGVGPVLQQPNLNQKELNDDEEDDEEDDKHTSKNKSAEYLTQECNRILQRFVSRNGDPCALICAGDDSDVVLYLLDYLNKQWLDGKFPYLNNLKLESDGGDYKRYSIEWAGSIYNYSRRPYAFTVYDGEISQVWLEDNN